MTPPCLCKVDCGSLQACNPFWLATLATLLATAATAVAILRLRRGPAAVTPPSGLLRQGNSSSSDDSDSSTSSSSSSSASSCSSEEDEEEEEEEEQRSEAAQPPPPPPANAYSRPAPQRARGQASGPAQSTRRPPDAVSGGQQPTAPIHQRAGHARDRPTGGDSRESVSYTHLTLPTNREV